MSIFFWVVLVFIALSIICVVYLKKVPHGWVQWRTGLVLKFLPSLDSLPVIKLRASLEDFIKKKSGGIKKSLPVDAVRDIRIPTRHGEINSRLFQNNDHRDTELIILIHGGGWCVGSINTYEEVSRRLVRETGRPLLSLEYSLAPEHKFPQAHEECLDAVSWIAQNMDRIVQGTRSLVLIGDSAGGNLIVATAYDCSVAVRGLIKKIVAVYPAVDSKKNDYESSINYASGYYLTGKAMSQFSEGLTGDKSDLNDPRLNPLYNVSMPDFPETFVITAEFDPLRDQGETFAAKLSGEGSLVTLKRYAGTIHAFWGLKDFGSRGVKAISDIRAFLDGEKISGTRNLE